MNFKGIAGALSLVIVFITACKKDEHNPTQPAAQEGEVRLELEHAFGVADFSLNTPYMSEENEQLTFSTVKYYVSKIRLKKVDGTVWEQPNSYYLVDLSKAGNLLSIPKVPAGDYTEISYTIGVDSAHNVSGAQEGALSPANDMFWSWNTGYVFIKLEGTSPQASGNSFAYHVGGFSGANNAIRSNTHDFKGALLMVKPSAVPQIHLRVDLGAVFGGASPIKVATTSTIHMPGADAKAAADNFQQAFEFEHIHN